jgi:hypothetical protein
MGPATVAALATTEADGLIQTALLQTHGYQTRRSRSDTSHLGAQSVTAPSEADLTWLAYFASTPLT